MTEVYGQPSVAVKRQHRETVSDELPFVSTTMGPGRPPKTAREPSELGRRLIEACKHAGFSPTGLETAAGLSKGHMSRLVYGSRGDKAGMQRDVAVRLADKTHVSLEWLLTGRGAMVQSTWVPSIAEKALITARQHGVTEEAIQKELAEHVGEERSEIDWLMGFLAAQKQLSPAQQNRVHQKKIERVKRQRTKQKAAKQEAIDGSKVDGKGGSSGSHRRRAAG
jgi:hypothetical protein